MLFFSLTLLVVVLAFFFPRKNLGIILILRHIFSVGHFWGILLIPCSELFRHDELAMYFDAVH